MEFLGYLSLLFMGLTLGLVGAGGSILTIPILVYIFKIPIIIATTYSLLIVGVSAFIGTVRYRSSILFSKVALFALPSIIGVFSARFYILPNLPRSLGIITLDQAMILLLLTFMISSSYLMIRDNRLQLPNTKHSSFLNQTKIILLGFCLGLVMGLLGAGGGFLIIPTLILLMGFSMQGAVPTSLFIITLNSLIGFLSDKHNFLAQDWINIFWYVSLAVLGMLIGIKLGTYINASQLKKGFGWFICITAITIALREFII
ncbi:Sulfite exporter TauE/SafE family protein [Candidatus Megaera venefica]|uniref:Probable membrane transporter protein n=1 Tax=Candidatus Megaera venefica TaxID=2055910 RepID=A0ABU5NDH2_9RICK|nr:sulfite exporter TauE/SafE family protein [Candidatus Megaera venefica]MEA0971217.1 Sulfite exporter TauE/SafE family protein [Candidatus Megaera venefica]